jgi:amidohydrolase
VGVRSGAMLAAQDNFTLVLDGVGGHAAFPHLCRDPVVASAALVMSVQTLVSRGMNPLESGVVSVTQIDAGDGAHNVIPAKATIRGTIRALSDDALNKLREGLVHIASKTAEAHGLRLASSEFAKDNYPATMNDDGLFPFAAHCAGLVAETGKHTPVDPTMGAEDFAFLAQGVPAAFFFLGQGGDGHDDAAKSGCGKCCGRVPTNLGLHHPEFNLDEEVLKRGVALFVNLALRSLKDLSEASKKDAESEHVRESTKSDSFRLRESDLD